MSATTVAAILASIATLLEQSGDHGWHRRIARLANEFRAADPASDDYPALVREALALFGGAGSFQDLVLQSGAGVLPEQTALDRFRHDLFKALREEL